MTKEQLEYQLERIDNVLKNSSISDDDKTMLEQQKIQLKERLDAMLPKEEVKQEEPVEVVEQVEVKEPVIEDTQEEQKTYEQKVDEFINNIKSANISKHFGSFTFKSDCEYYVEKNILDIFNNISQGPKNANFYLIYKISTLEDSNIDDSLLMSIYYNIDEEKIILD